MCDVYWQEFKRWIKAFTKTEVLLSILEGILLIVCIAFLSFLIMHFLVCPSRPGTKPQTEESRSMVVTATAAEDKGHSFLSTKTTRRTPPGTFAPGLKCTWERSRKTTAVTHYYENDKSTKKLMSAMTEVDKSVTTATPSVSKLHVSLEGVDALALDDMSDGEESNDVRRTAVLALVRERGGDTFGCALTAVTLHWTLTAASCIDAIEEVDSLDNFVMLERYGEAARGRSHAVADVRPHPHYAGDNRTYDVAALRSAAPLRAVNTLRLPQLQDYFLLTMGERVTLFGFGPFRNVEANSNDRHVREVSVYVLPTKACVEGDGGGAGEGNGTSVRGSEDDTWSPRHLSRGRPLTHGGCGAASLCAGPLYARGAPCHYCAGCPLARGGLLLGIMTSRRCGVSCEPALYVNIVLIRDWIDMVIADE